MFIYYVLYYVMFIYNVIIMLIYYVMYYIMFIYNVRYYVYI